MESSSPGWALMLMFWMLKLRIADVHDNLKILSTPAPLPVASSALVRCLVKLMLTLMLMMTSKWSMIVTANPYQVFYCHCTTCRVQTGALAVLFGAFPRSSVIEISTHCSFNVFLVSFSSCFDWFLMWYTSLNNFTQVNLNTSLTRFQSSELPSYRVFCSKCGSFVAMDYGEWTILIVGEELLKLIRL